MLIQILFSTGFDENATKIGNDNVCFSNINPCMTRYVPSKELQPLMSHVYQSDTLT